MLLITLAASITATTVPADPRIDRTSSRPGTEAPLARFQLDSGPIPLHHQVYLDLRAALEAGEWRPGDRLPPERELAARYGCSLITVRRALTTSRANGGSNVRVVAERS